MTSAEPTEPRATEATEPIGPQALRDLASTLRVCKPWTAAASAASRAGDMMLAALVAADRWDTLPKPDQAAVYWAMIEGAELDPEKRRDRDKQVAQRLADLLRHVAGVCEGTRTPSGRLRQVQQAEALLRRLDRLPAGWRVEAALRGQADGDMLGAISETQTTINRLRTRRGIDVRRDDRAASGTDW